jgi:hypothetical protein
VQPPVQSVVEEPVVQPPDEPPVEQWRREGIERDGGPASPAVDVASNGTHATPPVGQPAPEESPGAPLDHYPLPTRVPGANLAHTPAAPGGEPVDEHDPIRPFRVHEMLARHTQGVKHGRQGEATDDPAPDPAPNASAESPLDSPLDQSENLT